MAYGYRLNVEDIFLQHADKCWKKALKNMDMIEDQDPETAKGFTFLGPKKKKSISNCVFAVTGWAICLESYVNLAWNTNETTQNKKDLFREKNTVEKLKYILKEDGIDLSDKNWLSGIKDLILARNNLVHFKEVIEWVGFSFAPKYQKDLSQENLQRYRDALEEAIRLLSTTAGVEARLLKGDYCLFTYED
jgi:hypothetical protein